MERRKSWFGRAKKKWLTGDHGGGGPQLTSNDTVKEKGLSRGARRWVRSGVARVTAKGNRKKGSFKS